MRWAGFGAGCWLVRLGTWIELAGVVLLVLAVELTLFGILVKTRELVVLDWSGPFAVVPFWTLLFAGSIMGAVGRFRMLAVPPDTGASGVLNGALVLNWLRVTALIAALVFALLSGFEWRNQQFGGMVRYALYAGVAHGLAVIAGRLAELSIIPAMAVLGGEIPNGPLRRRAGLVALVFQIVAMVWVGMGIFVYYLAVVGNKLDGLLRRPGAKSDEPPADPQTALYAIGTVFLMVLAIEVAYTCLFASLYSAGLRAVAGSDAAASPAPRS